jgi:hypothetical protein
VPWLSGVLVSELAHWLGLVPLAFLLGLHLAGKDRHAGWWWMAVALGVSWVADTAAHWLDPWIVSATYPVSQAAIMGRVILPSRREAVQFLAVLVLMGIGAVLYRGVEGPDVVLRTVAWLGLAGAVLDQWALGRVRTFVLVYFGLGWAFWWIHARWLIVPTWYSYQACRAVGIGLFCWAAYRPEPSLRLEAA